MSLSPRDSEPVHVRDSRLLQIMDASLAEAARRAGPWLACRPGCTQCCHGAFAVNALDVARLRTGIEALHAADPITAQAVEQRARAWIASHAADFPGDSATGVLGTSEEDQKKFEDFDPGAPCPALDPATGLCNVYEHRPMTCRVFRPPVRMEAEEGSDTALGCCELCFVGAGESDIAACEMPVPHALESEILAQLNDPRQTVVAYALLRG